MSDINFVRDGKPGDEVWHPAWGNGIIKTFNAGTYPVQVEFECTVTGSFTPWGVEYGGQAPTLCWGHQKPLDQGKPPVLEPKPLVFRGQPVWAYVSDFKHGWKKRRRHRVVCRINDGQFIAMNDEQDEYSGDAIYRWQYAWEIPKECKYDS